MSDVDPDLDPDDNDDDLDPNTITPERLKQIRDAANRSKKNKAEADTERTAREALARENAFIKAGVDTDHPLAKRLMAGFEGEMTKDGVLAYLEEMKVTDLLTEAGATTTTTTEDMSGMTPEEKAQAEERQRLAGDGAPPAGDSGEHPAHKGLAEAFDIIENGGSREDGATAFFNKLFEGAVKGDERVLASNKGGGYLQE